MNRERLGSITAGGTAYKLRLAGWRPLPYQVQSRLVFPQFQDIPGAEGKVSGDPFIRQWFVNDWSKGEGFTWWEPGGYSGAVAQAGGAIPTRVGSGLQLPPHSDLSDHDNASPADFSEARRFGLAQGKLWACRDATVHEWQPSTENWDETGTATGGTGTPTSIIDQGNGTNLLIGYDNTDEIRQVAPGGANAQVSGLSLSYGPVLRNFGGTLFYLDGDDLYSFTMSGAAATETLVADVTGNSSDYLANGNEVYNRMSLSDKGPIWFQRTNSGETFVHEYNVATATHKVLAKLPVDFATPYGIFFTHGFYFVSFRYANRHADPGRAYLFVFRGAQRYVAGPIRDASDTWVNQEKTGSNMPLLIAGVIGDNLMLQYDDHTFAYNLTAGGLYWIGSSTTTGLADTITFGADMFISDSSNGKARRLIGDQYYTEGIITTGRHDFGYKGIDKCFLDISIVTDPLPANTSVTAKYSVEGATLVALTGTHDTDNATSYTWTISSPTTAVVGQDIEFQFVLASTSSTATPTVRSFTARAIGAEREVIREFEVDMITSHGGVEGLAPRSADALADLETLAGYNGLVSLSIPWEGEEWDADVTKTAVIEQIGHGKANPDEPVYAVIRTRDTTYV